MANLPATAPAYARGLESRALRAEAENAAYEQGIYELRAYLCSQKFWRSRGHDMVNVSDVLLRLDETTNSALQASAAIA